MSEEVTAAPEATGFVGSDGTFGDMASAPDSVKSLVEKSGFKSVDSLATSYSELSSKVGTSFKLPDELSDDQRGEMLSKLGTPSEVGGYTLPDGMQFDENVINGFKEASLKSGMTQGQFEGTLGYYNEMASQVLEQERDSGMKAIIEQLGVKEENDPKVTEFLDQASDIADKIGIAETLTKKGLQNDPAIMNALHTIYKQSQEGKLPVPKGETTEPIADKRSRLMSELQGMSRMDPGYKAKHQEWLSTHIG